jgi:hypothetical protein
LLYPAALPSVLQGLMAMPTKRQARAARHGSDSSSNPAAASGNDTYQRMGVPHHGGSSSSWPGSDPFAEPEASLPQQLYAGPQGCAAQVGS